MVMEEVCDDEEFKISAFSKFNRINNSVKDVTIGPNSLTFKNAKTKNKAENKDIFNIQNEQESNNDNGLPVRHVLRELEIQRQEQVKTALDAHINKFELFSKAQEDKKKQHWLRTQEEFIENMRQEESSILQALQQYEIQNSNNHAKLAQQYHNLAAEQRRKQELALKIKEKQMHVLNVSIDKIKKNQLEFRTKFQEILTIIKSCTNSEELKVILGDDFKLLKTLPESIEEAITKCKNGEITDEEVNKTSEIVCKINKLKSTIEEAVNRINNKNQENRETEKSKYNPKKIESSEIQNENLQETANTPQDKVEISNTKKFDIDKYISLKNLQMYTDLIEFQEKHTESFRQLETDSSMKQFKFDCQKAINIPVNALSGLKSEHILDKYSRLHKLLSGQNVMVSDKQINASRHPQGIAFCMDLLAKKFVFQGDVMVSSNPESAFCYASVIISLWNDFPVLGNLLLSYFFKSCPYLVPYYIPRQVGESDEEFYGKQGYQYNDGQIENHDKFLKRMTGIVRLYCAIMIVKPKRGQSKSPYNLRNGWRWIAAFLKLEPRVDVSATVLHTFLETVGFEMEAKYGRIFKKIMRIILEKFFPECRAKCTGGAVTRLELLLTEYLRNGRFQKPNGYLEYSHW